MKTSIQPGVRRHIESGKSDETVSIIVGVRDTSDALIHQIKSIGGTVEAVLPYNSLAVSIAESDLETLCEIEAVESVEKEGIWTEQDEENFYSPTDSTL